MFPRAGAPDRPVALVTGAGRRVGQAIARALALRGCDLAVHYHASAEGAAQTAAGARGAGVRAELFAEDLTRADAPERLVERVVQVLGRLDVVVNSAAVMLRMPVGEVTPEQWDVVMDLNLRAPFFISQAAARHLPDGGVIVNIADLSAFESWPGYLPHAASKAGLVHLTRGLARALAPRVRVNAVAPGTVLLPEGWDPTSAERLRKTTPLERWGTPDDVVHAVLYLLDAPYVTGQTIVVDGGRSVRK
ncbi:MAG TPA: SDR family oxidoreductase [Gemmatimonadaceae bacterium]|nr:SDR family oxidoreductase [Gemmatimonadaceae bacterium]